MARTVPMPGVVGVIEDLRRGLANTVVASHLMPPPTRHALLRRYGLDLAPTAVLRPGFYVSGPDIAVGERTFINFGCIFDCAAPIRIGPDCDIGMEVLFCTSTHETGAAARRAAAAVSRPIVVGAGCWIGARATVLPGVSIAPGCIVAAGAVLVGDTTSHGLYGGVPAARLRDLPM